MIHMNQLILNIYGLFNSFSSKIEHAFFFSLTFVYSPPSDTYGYQSVELIPNGSHIVRKNSEDMN
jgi:hypothetical protein